MAESRKCLEFGRDSARTECGVSYALDALGRKKVDIGAVRTGIETARIFAARAGELLPAARKLAKEVARAAAEVDEEIRGLAEIPEGKAGRLRKKVEDLKEKARRLFEKGEGMCGR